MSIDPGAATATATVRTPRRRTDFMVDLRKSATSASTSSTDRAAASMGRVASTRTVPVRSSAVMLR